MSTILIPVPLRPLTGGRSRVEVPGASVGEVLDRLDAQHPGVRAYLFDEAGRLRPYVNVFVNQTEIRQAAGLATPLVATDEVAIIPAMAGGASARTSCAETLCRP
jgi:molybdopterin synthase sulfur carrier subunit